MKAARSLLLVVSLLVVLSGSVLAQVNSYPVDVPGTNVQFFMMRYEGPTPPYAAIQGVWERLGTVFHEWSLAGRNPEELRPAHVTVGRAPSGQMAVMLKGSIIVEVDDFHARYNRASQSQLAEKWAGNLRRGVDVFVEHNRAK